MHVSRQKLVKTNRNVFISLSISFLLAYDRTYTMAKIPMISSIRRKRSRGYYEGSFFSKGKRGQEGKQRKKIRHSIGSIENQALDLRSL